MNPYSPPSSTLAHESVPPLRRAFATLRIVSTANFVILAVVFAVGIFTENQKKVGPGLAATVFVVYALFSLLPLYTRHRNLVVIGLGTLLNLGWAVIMVLALMESESTEASAAAIYFLFIAGISIASLIVARRLRTKKPATTAEATRAGT